MGERFQEELQSRIMETVSDSGRTVDESALKDTISDYEHVSQAIQMYRLTCQRGKEEWQAQHHPDPKAIEQLQSDPALATQIDDIHGQGNPLSSKKTEVEEAKSTTGNARTPENNVCKYTSRMFEEELQQLFGEQKPNSVTPQVLQESSGSTHRTAHAPLVKTRSVQEFEDFFNTDFSNFGENMGSESTTSAL